jgi:hypothetical protein
LLTYCGIIIAENAWTFMLIRGTKGAEVVEVLERLLLFGKGKPK